MTDETGATARMWTDVVRRARLTGVVRGVRKDSLLAGDTVKAVAMTLASYADPDGTRVFPGVARVATDCEISYQIAGRCIAGLRELGLLKLVRRAKRRGARTERERADEYRLTLPADLLDRIVVPTPSEYRAKVTKLDETHRRRGPGVTQSSPEPSVLAVTQSSPKRDSGGVSRHDAVTAKTVSGDDAGTVLGMTQSSPTYTQDLDTTDTSHSGDDLRTAVAVTRAREAESTNHDSPPLEADQPRLRIVTGTPGRQPSHPTPGGHRQAALWPALVREEPAVKAEEAKAQIRATLAGHRPAPLRRYADRPKPKPPQPAGSDPPPKLDLARIARLGFCTTCHLAGKVVASVEGADGCRTHMTTAGVA